jgi:hypothetical protein
MNQYLLNDQRVYDASNYSNVMVLTFLALGNSSGMKAKHA